MINIEKISEQYQATARQIIKDTNIIKIWEDMGAKVNLVGSLKSGLLIKHRDIDFHIYTHQLVIKESFKVMEKLAENPRIKEITYKNLIETEEECLEWHAWYEDKENHIWQLDLIHILKGSKYDGVVEKVTEAVRQSLTPEIRNTILQIKYDMPEGSKIMGVEIYRAVLCGGVKSYNELLEWHTENPFTGLDWLP